MTSGYIIKITTEMGEEKNTIVILTKRKTDC